MISTMLIVLFLAVSVVADVMVPAAAAADGGTAAASAPAIASASLPATNPSELQRVRELYFAAVQSSDALDEAERLLDRRLNARAELRPDSEHEAVLTAYSGALRTLRAKHGRWPPARLRDLQEGLQTLDSLVVSHPSVAEIRYLRLMSCYYLPSLLGRTASVREDFRALAHLLPGARASFPLELYATAANFVLDNGNLTASERVSLERSLAP